MSAKSWGRLRTRSVLLLLLFVPVILWEISRWMLFGPRQDATSKAHALERWQYSNATGHELLPLALPRQLEEMEWGYECLSENEYYDLQMIRLRMVRKYHVTMGGVAGENNTCLSQEGPCLRPGTRWALIMYLPAMFYMFIALAIVCDEFFVPSLEAFVDHFQISMDVAGATFMAAGGSMPELFTSFIATFDKTDVGFSAIVGSAVFNVLFVIAVCALASLETLTLTWWPLARDCSFYLVGLALVVIFFSSTSPNEIEIWEAFILFAWYVIYCSFMLVNSDAHDWVQGKLDNRKSQLKVAPEVEVEPPETDETCKPLRLSGRETVSMRRPSQFRAGIVALVTQRASVTETVGISVVMEFKGNVKDAFKKACSHEDGCLREDEFKTMLQRLGWKAESPRKQDAASRVWQQLNRAGKLDWDMFYKWFIVSEARVEVEAQRVFDRFDRNGDGTIDIQDVEAVLRTLGHKPTQQDLADILREILSSKPVEASPEDCGGDKPEKSSASVTFDQFGIWYNTSMLGEEHKKQMELENQEDEDQGFKIDWPPEDASLTQLFWYFFTYPLCAAIYCSLPDVRREGMQGNFRWAVIEFLLSLVWIAIFSNCLYECTVVCSNTIGIPPPVAGVTILAAGTSIPDLLSSYIVARQGQGDMAVSSSIGSNLFDITVGLPIPWISFIISESITTGNLETVKVKSKSPAFSVLVLMSMLASVIGTVMISRWKLTRLMGGVMLFLYFVFLFVDLMQKLPSAEEPAWDIRF